MMFLLILLLSTLALSTDLAEDQPSEAAGLKLLWEDDLRMSLYLSDSSRLTILLLPASNLHSEPTPCLFSGALDHDNGSVVAVSGCRESMETVVTIASGLVPGGLVDLVVSNGTTHSIGDDASGTNRLMNPFYEDMIIPPANLNPPAHHMAEKRALPNGVVLKTRIRYDDTLLRHFNDDRTLTRQWLSRVVEMAKPRLAHSSLNTKIQIELVGEMEHVHEDIQADETTIRAISARNPRSSGVTSYFCSQLGGGTIGIAFLGTACRQDGTAININELYTRTNSELMTARVWVHELGHNIGMRHDFDVGHGGKNGACNKQGLMSYGNVPDRWSTCSNNDFAAWFRDEGYTCLPSAVFQEPKCQSASGSCMGDWGRACQGRVLTGFCPTQPGPVKCCVDKKKHSSEPAPRCRAEGGYCMRSWNCPRGAYVHNKCPGDNTFKCCLSVPYQESKCRSVGGSCVGESSCSGRRLSGFCPTQPGPIKCCIGG